MISWNSRDFSSFYDCYPSETPKIIQQHCLNCLYYVSVMRGNKQVSSAVGKNEEVIVVGKSWLILGSTVSAEGDTLLDPTFRSADQIIKLFSREFLLFFLPVISSDF